MDDRLIELESRLAFQDHSLQALNDVIVRQQREIDELRRALAALHAHLKTLSPALVAGRSEETPPPHY